MPPRTTTRAAGGTSRARAAAAKTPKAEPRGKTPAGPGEAPMKTFAEFVGSRPYDPRADSDEKKQLRSFSLDTGLVERLRATADGISHKAYDTDLEGRVPPTIAGLAAEAIEAICTYYENLLNGGQEFRRVRRLSPGPSKEGAAIGAAKRAAARAAKAGRAVEE